MHLSESSVYRQAIAFEQSGKATRASVAQSARQRALEEAINSTDTRNCEVTEDAIIGPEEDVMLVALRLDDLQTDFGLKIKLVGNPERICNE